METILTNLEILLDSNNKNISKYNLMKKIYSINNLLPEVIFFNLSLHRYVYNINQINTNIKYNMLDNNKIINIYNKIYLQLYSINNIIYNFNINKISKILYNMINNNHIIFNIGECINLLINIQDYERYIDRSIKVNVKSKQDNNDIHSKTFNILRVLKDYENILYSSNLIKEKIYLIKQNISIKKRGKYLRKIFKLLKYPIFNMFEDHYCNEYNVHEYEFNVNDILLFIINLICIEKKNLKEYISNNKIGLLVKERYSDIILIIYKNWV